MFDDIRHHPLYPIGTAIVGTIGICILVFKEIVLPTMTEKLQNKIEKLSEAEDNLQNLLSKTREELKLETDEYNRATESLKKEYNLKIDNLTKELKLTKIKLQDLETINLFQNNSPYPTTLDQVKIGDPIIKLLSFFDEKDIKKEDEYWSVKSNHAVFSDITYYINSDQASPLVSHILFWQREKHFIDKNFLQTKLENAFGKPKTFKKKGYYEWHGTYHNIFKSDEDDYLLMDANSRPAYFPDK